MHPKRAAITGITGQDGSYLAEFLVSKGYEVHGIIRRSSNFNTGRIDPIYDQLHLHFGDVTDAMSLLGVLQKSRPQEVYNLAAQSHVRVSFDQPVYTGDTVALGTAAAAGGDSHLSGLGLRVRCGSIRPRAPRCTAAWPRRRKRKRRRSSPRSPVCLRQGLRHMLTVNYRESYDMFASCGILFNHESPRRGETFVTRKITRAVAPHQARPAREL